MNANHYVIRSLELHLFFSRIMKEHALFLRAAFTPADPALSQKAESFLQHFNKLLCQVVALSDGMVTSDLLSSGEIVTEFTDLAEKQTERLTTLPIDRAVTGKTLCLKAGSKNTQITRELFRQVRQINRTALVLLDELICFKEGILGNVLQGEMFTMNYPLLIEHIIREAKLYRKYVETLEREGYLPSRIMKETETFWNRIMMEHALFIRGLLDPCEEDLIHTADDFASCYCELLEASCKAQDQTLTAKTLEQTLKFRDFKAAGTAGIQQCKIRSVILPLLADHVLREANHYIRLLKHGS